MEDLETLLQSLTNAIDRLPTLEEPPLTTLAILGETRTEAYWEALLEYHLDPKAPHGFGTDVLEAFFSVLRSDTQSTLYPQIHNLSAVQVASQVGTHDGVPDLLLWVPDEWFCCIELKAHSGESDDQTIRYADSKTLGPLTVTDYPESARHYLYLAPAATAPPASERFVEMNWEAILPSFRELLATDRGQYPAKSRAQFADYIDTLEDELNMTEYEEYEREKVALAIEHGDAITTAQSAVEEYLNKERNVWQEDFKQTAPPGWSSDQTGEKYPRLLNSDWYLSESGRVETAEEAELVLGYVSKVDAQTLLNQNLTIGLKRFSGANDRLEQRVERCLYSEETQAELAELQDEHELRLFDREKVQIFEVPISINLRSAETLGGQFATSIRDLEPVHDLIDRTLSDVIS
jgi:hypothetical protein